jgi:two-component system NtrC family sensor kinase
MNVLRIFIILFFVNLPCHGQYNPTIYTIDSLIQLLGKTSGNGQDSTRYELLFQLGLANQSVNPDKTVFYFNECLKVAKRIGDKKRIVNCLLSLSFAYSDIGESPKSIEMLHEVLHVAEHLKGDSYAMALAFLGKNYADQGEYVNALYYTRSAFLMAEEKLKDTTEPFDGIAYIAGPLKLGEILLQLKKTDSALIYAELTYHRMQEKPQALFSCDMFNLLGNIHNILNHPSQAIYFFQLALQKAKELNFPVSVQQSQMALAKYYQTTKYPDSAISYAMLAYTGAAGLKGYSLMKESASLLRFIYEKKGLFERALHFSDLATAARDSVTGAEKVREIQLLKNKEEIRQQKMQQQIEADQVASRNRVQLISLLAILAVVFLLAGIFYRNSVQKHKANILLQQQKEEIQRTLAALKDAQAQLIQSEKMASLGVLTAGIAHEIQNPLNFINNFSEVNVELIDELDAEINLGNYQEAGSLATSLKENELIINAHGKRAGAIVKGMLQHSREPTGKKETVDINALADEYLRLSYHGFRAKDESFYVDLKSEFDKSIEPMQLIPQEIGRVLLNIYNNAFYAIAGKMKNQGSADDLFVLVRTVKLSGKVEIRIRDNGTGIPKNIADKIFQPFFTTKPTGQGTGLGLSISYDVMKAHGGEIKFAGEEGQYTEFIITIPETKSMPGEAISGIRKDS